MDVDKMLAELRVEREQLEEAILTLERLARGRGRRRGRPPAWLKEAAQAASSEEPAGSASSEPKKRSRGVAPARHSKLAVAAEA